MEKLDLSILREGYIEGYMNLRLRQNIMLYSFALLFVCDVMSQFKYGLDSSGHIWHEVWLRSDTWHSVCMKVHQISITFAIEHTIDRKADEPEIAYRGRKVITIPVRYAILAFVSPE